MGERISVRFYPEDTSKSRRSKRFAICFLAVLILLLLAYIAAFIEMSRENLTCESPPMPTFKELTHNTVKTVPTEKPLPAKKTESHAVVHIVEAEQTLYSIARTYNVSIENIRKANNIKGNTIITGMKLMIPVAHHQK